MSALETLINTQIFAFLLIFARVGCALMLMPGFGDTTVPMNVRLFLALSLSLALTPLLYPLLPGEPKDTLAFALLVVKELLVGLFLGFMSQMMMNALSLAGVIIAHITSLSSAFTFNPQQAIQLTVVSSFLALLAVVMIFVTDLHHVLIYGLVDSYRLFDPKQGIMFEDMTNTFASGLSQSLHIGLMMSAPFMIVGFAIFIGMGLVARLVPQIQVFTLSMPVQIMVGLFVMMTSISAVMLYFLEQYQDYWQRLFS